jgi:hypothetical protein
VDYSYAQEPRSRFTNLTALWLHLPRRVQIIAA